MKYFFIPFFIFVAILVPASAYAITITYPKVDNLPSGSGSIKGFGTTEATGVQDLTKYLQLWNVHSISLLATSNASFSNENIVVSASVDNTTWYTIDTVAEGSAAIKGLFYSDAIKATSVAINPALFPYLKIVVAAPATGHVSLTWSSGNEANIS